MYRYREHNPRASTPESRQYKADMRAKKKAGEAFAKEWDRLRRASKDLAARSDTERIFVKELKEDTDYTSVLDQYFGPDSFAKSRWNSAFYLLRDAYFRGLKVADFKDKAKNLGARGYMLKRMWELRKPLRDVYSEEILKGYFAPKMVIANNRITDRFENEFETLGKKIDTQHALVRALPEIEAEVDRDLRRGSEPALITALIMDTGIRPGAKEGERTPVEKDGDEEPEETFGAVNLLGEHVTFVDDIARLEFVGKKGTVNRAVVRNPVVVRELRRLKKQTRPSEELFPSVRYADLARYFREGALRDFNPTDFRKLKANETLLRRLREEQKRLYQEKNLRPKQLEGAVARAYKRTQEALNHKDVKTTVKSYVNPEILIRFLQQGYVPPRLEDLYAHGLSKLRYGPGVFREQAKRRLPAVGSTVAYMENGRLQRAKITDTKAPYVEVIVDEEAPNSDSSYRIVHFRHLESVT